MLSRLLGKGSIICLNVKVANHVCGVPSPEQVDHQPSAQLTLQIFGSIVIPKASHAVKIMGSHSHLPSAIWKVWVLHHHLSTRDCTKMALSDLFGRRQTMGSKPVARMWAFVALARSPYHSATRLVLPLLEYGEIACEKECGDVRFTIWIKEQWKGSFRFPIRCKMVLESHFRWIIGWETDEKGVQNGQNRVST